MEDSQIDEKEKRKISLKYTSHMSDSQISILNYTQNTLFILWIRYSLNQESLESAK